MPPSVVVSGVPSSQLTPDIYMQVVLGGPGTSPGTAPYRTVVFENLIGSNITATVQTNGSGGTQVFTTPAGTGIVGQPVQVYSPADAASVAGLGSMLHLAGVKAFGTDPNAVLFLCPVAESGGERATGVITPTIASASTAGTIRLLIAGRIVDVPVAAGDAITTIGMNIALAINRLSDLPVTAQNVWATGAVTLSAKHPGPSGNYITFRALLMSSSSTTKATAGTLAATNFGVTITLSGGTASGGVYRLSGGTTDWDITTALANVSSTLFDRYVVPAYVVSGVASANLALVAAQMDTIAGPTVQLNGQAVYGTTEPLGTSTTLAELLASTLNRSRGSMPWAPKVDALPIEVATADAIGRLAGDATLGGNVGGENTNPAANLNGLELAIPSQDVVSDVPSRTQIEAALHNGLSPIVPSFARPGQSKLVASITTRSVDAQGNPSLAVYKTLDVTVPDFCARGIRQDFTTAFGSAKIAADNPDGTGPKIPNVVTPSMIRGRAYGLMKEWEGLGYVIEVDQRYPQLVVALDATNPRRVNMDLPVVPAPDLDIIAANVRQQTP